MKSPVLSQYCFNSFQSILWLRDVTENEVSLQNNYFSGSFSGNFVLIWVWRTIAWCPVITFKVLNIADYVVRKQEKPLGHALHINQTTDILGSSHCLKTLQNSKALIGGEGRSYLGKCGGGSTRIPTCPYSVFIHLCIYDFLHAFTKHLSSASCFPGWVLL